MSELRACLNTLADAIQTALEDTTLADNLDGIWWAHTVVERSEVFSYLYGYEDHLDAFDTPWDWDALSDEEFEAVRQDPRSKWPNYIDYVPTEEAETVADELNDHGFSASLTYPNYAHSIRITGWPKSPSWFQEGDFVNLWKWKTPLTVVEVLESGAGVPVGVPVAVGDEGRTLVLKGSKGGRYVVHQPDGDEDWHFYQKSTNDADTFEKTHVSPRLVFVGNPDTGPRGIATD